MNSCGLVLNVTCTAAAAIEGKFVVGIDSPSNSSCISPSIKMMQMMDPSTKETTSA
jgi:hypothetical protein